ncbi:MAG: hypothetical protein M3Q64_03270 [bacterium]|nr:hypothetical protein [bacterium]
MTESHLKKLGLEKGEIAIYLAVVKYGGLSPTEVAKITGIKRATVYLYVEHLRELGLVTTRLNKKRKIIVAAPFSSFETLVQEKKAGIEQQEKIVADLIPLLEKMYKEKTIGIQIEMLEGQSGVTTLIEKIIAEKKDMYWLGSMETILSTIKDEKLFRLMTWRRMDQKTTSYAISDRTILKNERYSGPTSNFRQFRFLEQPFSIPGIIVLFGKNIALISIKETKISIVLVQDETMNQIVLFMFKALWEFLPKS